MAVSDGEGSHQAPQSLPTNRYFWGQVVPRRREILFHWTSALAILTAICLYSLAHWTSFGEVSIDSIRASITAYAALSFGASIGGSVLILTLPNRQFIRTASLHRLEGRRFSSFSDLLFVFTFSAIAQLWTIGVVIAMYGLGGSEQVLPERAFALHHILFLLAALVVAYSVFRLIVVVTTLSQLGVVIGTAAMRDDDEGAGVGATCSEPKNVEADQPSMDSEESCKPDVSEGPPR